MEFSLCPAGSLFERPTKLKKGACSIKRMSLHSGDGRSIRIDTQHLQLVASVSFLEKILGSLSPGQTMQCQHFFCRSLLLLAINRTVGTVCQWRPAFRAHLIGIEGRYRNRPCAFLINLRIQANYATESTSFSVDKIFSANDSTANWVDTPASIIDPP